MTTTMRVLLVTGLLAMSSAAAAGTIKSLRVCADPGNMPLSNDKGEGFENKIAEVIAAELGTKVQYYFRPTIERGLTRTTLDADECDLMIDMPSDSERVITTPPLYRTTFVLAYRNDRGLKIKNFDDPQLKKLKVGVYQTSGIREALAQHDVKNNTVVHYLSHNSDLVPENQPSHQIQEVIDGKLDIAAAWGPMAGYFKTIKQAPLVIQPVNLWEDHEPMEFDMSIAFRRRDKDLKDKVEAAMIAQRAKIQQILVDYGVPLVKCSNCLIPGNLPAHGPYAPERTREVAAAEAEKKTVSIETLEQWLKQGANVNDELNNAVIGDDLTRVSYLIEKKGADINARDPQSYTPLLNAIRKSTVPIAQYLIDHNADIKLADNDGWTPLMTASWMDNAAVIRLLTAKGIDLKALNPQGLTALCVAAQYGKLDAEVALIEAGANVNETVGAGYTPLMLAVVGGSPEAAETLIGKGANVNARNAGGVTALMIAAASNQGPIASVLLKAGADSAAQSEDGKTALSIARDRDSQAVIKLLEAPTRQSSLNGQPIAELAQAR